MSNLIAAFIVAVAASTLFRAGLNNVETLREAASALEPLAGPAAVWLFMIGVVGSGILAIPILAGSAAYIAAETFGWNASLDKPFSKARKFYLVMLGAVAVSIFTPFLGITPVQALFWIAVLNGAMTPPLIVIITHMANNPKIVGDNRTTRPVHVAGTAAFFIMLTGAFLVFFS
jgi:Mn2+/Fe2+ NRAMP family transporter